MSPARVEGYPDTLRLWIGIHFFHSRNTQERFPQRANAFVAIIALSGDVYTLEHLMISGVVQVMRIGWVH